MTAKSDKVWADAVSRAVHAYDKQKDENGKAKKIRWLNVLADQLVAQAAKGDIAALKEIGDRLDGKATQGIEAKVNGSLTINLLDPTLRGNKPAP